MPAWNGMVEHPSQNPTRALAHDGRVGHASCGAPCLDARGGLQQRYGRR